MGKLISFKITNGECVQSLSKEIQGKIQSGKPYKCNSQENIHQLSKV